jgi:hypothetical protein
MKLENQVCNLELAKKLKELGIKQKSYFYWQSCCNGWLLSESEYFCTTCEAPVKTISAFTVAELGEMLPDNIYINSDICWLDITKIINKWSINYRVGCAVARIKIEDKNEANAKAKMLTWLIENKHIKTESL